MPRGAERKGGLLSPVFPCRIGEGPEQIPGLKRGVMNKKPVLITIFCLSLDVPVFVDKKHGQRAMIEKMEAVPCGAKERGLTGLGSVFASVGATHVDSDEKLCPQYMLRTDDMEYHIRPLDHKHPRLLPIGQEGEFKISKDVIEMKIPDGDHKKRRYQVVAMKPIDHSDTPEIGGNRMRYDKGQTVTNDKPLAQKVPQTKPY
ncbi:MAG: hypothetical protein DMG78_25450 [Acidobacteria bacterium]|nr:MAG: hypothetical protein DMG78_25450 [Acidobacteriota bacterium]